MSPGSTFLTPSVTSLLVSSPLPVEFRLGLAPGYFEASLIAKVASLTSARRSLRSSRISRTRRSSSRAIASDCGEWSITTAGEHTCALTWPEATELDGAAGTLTGRLREALGDVLENFSDACEHVSTTVWDHTGRLAIRVGDYELDASRRAAPAALSQFSRPASSSAGRGRQRRTTIRWLWVRVRRAHRFYRSRLWSLFSGFGRWGVSAEASARRSRVWSSRSAGPVNSATRPAPEVTDRNRLRVALRTV